MNEYLDNYYQKIKNLNILHYASEVSYYSNAPLRKAEIILLNGLKRESKILDLGCGSGRFSINAAKLGFSVTGVDITMEAIDSCRERAEKDKLTNADFLIGDMTSLPFHENNFDYVFCPRFSINAVATFEKRKQAVKEMVRVVKPNGKIFIESFNKFYLGKGILFFIKNISIDFYRYARIILDKLLRQEYKDLLPGDIIYKANKVLTASPGYAHLASMFELKRLIPKNLKVNFFSIPQIIENKRFDFLKFFRYSIWAIIEK